MTDDTTTPANSKPRIQPDRIAQRRPDGITEISPNGTGALVDMRVEDANIRPADHIIDAASADPTVKDARSRFAERANSSRDTDPSKDRT